VADTVSPGVMTVAGPASALRAEARQVEARVESESNSVDSTRRTVVRKLMAALITLALVVAAFAVGRASDRDEAVMTVQVSSADHELLEGYFTMGDSATVIAKKGSALYNFLARQRGKKIKLVLTESSGPELSRLDR
jgi:hypothetical protein